MHVLFTALSAHGHIYPLLPLARAVAARGDRVTFVTGADFHPLLTKLGFDTVEAGLGMHEAFGQAIEALGAPVDFRDPDDPNKDRAVARVFGTVQPRAFLAALDPVFERDRPDLVVYEVANPGAAIAARRRGIPAVSHGIARGDITGIFPEFDRLLTEVAAEHGVDISADPLMLADPYLDVYPASLQEHQHPSRVPLRPVAFADPGELPAWVAAHEQPLVYLTLGTAFGTAEVLRVAIDGLADLPVRVLVAAGPQVDADELRGVPDSVTVLPWVPQADLLPHADLVVHHGGSGTTLGSLAQGLPQLFLPQGADQFINADTITAAGIGRTLRGAEATSAAIGAAAAELLADDGARTAARAVADEIAAMPGPDEVAASLRNLPTS
ncbi:nucleotide disphospho-sugar-binding domain-containing protein [Actinokineospora soli]|uniref:Nucleotide disphospho-sugar-binding domain-containing protein n=1 Tax=Actinokineospora soli TaxID=1048753 RepID=A0ABW2TK14_9PSEU